MVGDAFSYMKEYDEIAAVNKKIAYKLAAVMDTKVPFGCCEFVFCCAAVWRSMPPAPGLIARFAFPL